MLLPYGLCYRVVWSVLTFRSNCLYLYSAHNISVRRRRRLQGVASASVFVIVVCSHLFHFNYLGLPASSLAPLLPLFLLPLSSSFHRPPPHVFLVVCWCSLILHPSSILIPLLPFFCLPSFFLPVSFRLYTVCRAHSPDRSAISACGAKFTDKARRDKQNVTL